jgi:glycosyltransferase involved in cell wall biosynthesis
VLSDIPTLRELWEDAAVLLPPREHRAWRDAVNSLAADPAKRARLAHRARLRASGFTATRSVGAYWDLYSGLLTRKPRAHRMAS